MSEQYTVVQNREAGRTLFAGTEEDARTFVQNQFPRLHNEPGTDYGEEGPQPDVVIVSPNGKREDGVSWNGAEWSDDKKKSEPRPPAKKAAAKKTTARGRG